MPASASFSSAKKQKIQVHKSPRRKVMSYVTTFEDEDPSGLERSASFDYTSGRGASPLR